MAFTNNPPSTPPIIIDEDIHRTVDTILKARIPVNDNDSKVGGSQTLPADVHTRLLESLSIAMQMERNGWKEKLHSTLQEIDRQHRASIAVQGSLQEMVDNLSIQPLLHSPAEIDRQHRASIAVQGSLQEMVDNLSIQPLLHSPHSDSSCSGRKSSDLITGLQTYILDLQDAVNKATRDNALEAKLKKMQDPASQPPKENPLEAKLKEMKVREECRAKATLAKLEKEKGEHGTTIREKSKEISWLHKELNAIKNQLHKLRKIVLNYNESHSTKFHLDDVAAAPKDTETTTTGPRGVSVSRERTYVEGDQLDYFATPGEEIALWKLRAKQHVPDSRGRGGGAGGGGAGGGAGGGHNVRTGIAQCLRCQQLFKPNENNAMACRYHKKGREIREQYDNSGRLSKVLYKWACCKRGLDVAGCTYGYHI